MKKGNMEVHEFDFCIYPRKLFIAVGKNPCSLKDMFLYINGEEFDLKDEKLNTAAAYTCSVELKKDGKLGVLVWFPNRSSMSARYCAHEAVHAALEVCGDIGVEVHFDNQEPLAYLVDYVVHCMDIVKNKKY
jgi:hypothetical protein